MREPPDPFPADWEAAVAAIADSPGVALVLGASDRGKTTWITTAARQLGHAGRLPLAVVDADIGQSTVGPPATVALALLRERPGRAFALEALPCDALSFVGSVSPIGHLLQMLVATKRLVERARRAGAESMLVDTTGLITAGAGFQLKLRKIELLDPIHLVVLQREAELEPLLSVVRERPGLRIHRLAVSPAARSRSPAERAAYRAACFTAYFAEAKRLALAADRILILAPPGGRVRPETGDQDLVSVQRLRAEGLAGLLVGLNDAGNETLGLGWLEGAGREGREVYVRTPLSEGRAIRFLQLGSMGVDLAMPNRGALPAGRFRDRNHLLAQEETGP